jgi:hypothetical protein
MRQAGIRQPVGRTRFYSSKAQRNGQLGQAALTVSNSLAVACLFFGAAFAAFVPASLEQRIGALFFFGLTPAAGFYAVGLILSQLLVFASELCAMIAARCFRCLAFLLNNLVTWISPPFSDVAIESSMVLSRGLLPKLSGLTRKAFRSMYRFCWCAQTALLEFSYLLIRTAARFLIRVQTSGHLKRGR